MAAHVELNHDMYASANQNKKLSNQSQQKTWSIFAEAYEADARDSWLSCPKYAPEGGICQTLGVLLLVTLS